jgi:hypothetical protein
VAIDFELLLPIRSRHSPFLRDHESTIRTLYVPALGTDNDNIDFAGCLQIRDVPPR